MSAPTDWPKVAGLLRDVRVATRKRETNAEWCARADAVDAAAKLCEAMPLIVDLMEAADGCCRGSVRKDELRAVLERLREAL